VSEWEVDARSGQVLSSKIIGDPRDTAAWEWRYVHPDEAPDPRTMDVVEDWTPVISPDGKRLIFGSNRAHPGFPWWRKPGREGLFLADIDGGHMSCLIPEEAACASWLPDGRHVAWIQPRHGHLTGSVNLSIVNLECSPSAKVGQFAASS
jgi:hypothetical protein